MNDGLAASYKISNDIIIDKINLESQGTIFSKYFNLKIEKHQNSQKSMHFFQSKIIKSLPNIKVECRTINLDQNVLGKISKDIL